MIHANPSEQDSDPHSDLVYDWNTIESFVPLAKGIEFDDETLRDGLQCPSVIDPPIEKKLEILHLMEDLGIHTLNAGLPGAGPRAVADVTAICEEIGRAKLSITANCAARTHINDITPCAVAPRQT